MKKTLLVLAVLGTLSARAQNYSIDWFTIDGGGGTSSGGNYSISGTIGQPDAGRMSGGAYTLDGGFWGIIAAVQTPGSPLLRIALSPTNSVIVAWPVSATGFKLQQSSPINSGIWTDVTNAPTVVGSENQIYVAPPAGNRYYRLKFP